ncbi:exosome complex [Babesia ovata]|uniref:Ribosomal RNA-processing protein 42 n=1 Tax=Babesia ovata TaxID=189622 RepID=A0A2H6KC11_9APIC|nr:exosome complex [Babesia ovata]GBE60527.1 exosome complex [Babesia ovata]
MVAHNEVCRHARILPTHNSQFSVSAPSKDSPDEGTIEITLASPFSLEDAEVSHKRDERWERTLEWLQFQRQRFDRRLLCILSGQFCWAVRLHSTILQRGGAFLDAISIGMVTALRTARIPNVQVLIRDELERSLRGTNVRVRLAEGHNLDLQKIALQLPICVTVAKIADYHVWAVTHEEATCADGFLTVAVSPEGRCIGMTAAGSCFQVPSIATLVEKACRVGVSQHQYILSAL